MEYCTNGGKKCFKSEKAANNSRNTIEKFKSHMRTYRCPYCHFWHLTSERGQWS